ncbi:D-amino acid dehydrogenase small subunit [Pigmentiphaga humi]|uniref:D-amino acid dehydrogenase small subunit n=1 Tax=Pigmentiphaga humi TaxID=2478468 RepID=A0A3P4AVS1_9BURK|nr:FAD-dependent oxidoreductase [Pigmentiphaga humi]VCU68113.1 D-amino acid dehydrogenase small subunit [Pigmentiphaga humi]
MNAVPESAAAPRQAGSPLRGSVVVLGAGLVGLACAHALQRDGYDVTVIDRGEPGKGASFGNAAHIATASIIPQSTPGILRQTIRLLRDPQGPLIVRSGYVLRHLPWFARFIAQGTGERAHVGTLAMAAMMAQAWDAWRPVLADIGGEDLARQSGALHIFGSAAALRAAEAAYALRRSLGVACETLELEQARAMEPALTKHVGGAVWIPSMGYVTDTLALARRLAGRIEARGGRILRAEATGIDARGVQTKEGRLPADRVVLAAGAWSHRLARGLGVDIPLVAERGYHVMLAPGSSPLRTPVLMVERKVAATPMAAGLRMASVAEFTTADARADHARAAPVFRGLERFVQGLDAKPVSEWVGPRPSVPDSRPILGQAPGAPHVLLAYGHGHLGLSLAALTGSVIADVASGRDPRIDMRAVAPLWNSRLR